MDIFETTTEIGGNTAKVKVLCELSSIVKDKYVKILDVGCVGPSPLQFWEPLLKKYPKNFELHGIDVVGIEKAKTLVETRGWKNVHLQTGSGYDLQSLYEKENFDVIVATQVLEHIAHLDKFLAEVVRVAKLGGWIFFTFDSAYPTGKYHFREPVKFFKILIKKILALIGNERHYDVPTL